MDTVTDGVHLEEADLYESASAEALSEYLTLMEDTEAPRPYLIWSLIAAVAGLIGKNAAFKRGPLFSMAPNLFVILLGPAGVRKTSAINQILSLLKDTTLNFGPTDTGGQRHGLMSAMQGMHRFNEQKPWRDPEFIPPMFPHLIRPRNPADMFLAAPELGRIMGIGSREMADFFVDLWDGAVIDYQTKASETVIRNGLVTMLGATTPSSLASILPDGATGHGILSRIVFVWADKKHKDVPIPPVPKEEWHEARERFIDRLNWVDYNRHDFTFESEADSAYIELYTYTPKLEDPRLEQYRERRPQMMQKIAMCLAALRYSTSINENDVRLAHQLLCEVEPDMHRALEYFGKNKAFVGRMHIIQYLRAKRTATRGELVAAAMSDLNKREADEIIESMLASKEIGMMGEAMFLVETARDEVKRTR